MHLTPPARPRRRSPRRGRLLRPSWPSPGYAVPSPGACHTQARARVLAAGLGGHPRQHGRSRRRPVRRRRQRRHGHPRGPGDREHVACSPTGCRPRSPPGSAGRWTRLPGRHGVRAGDAWSAPTSAAARRRHLPDRRPALVHRRRRHRCLRARPPAAPPTSSSQPACSSRCCPTGDGSWSPTGTTTASTGRPRRTSRGRAFDDIVPTGIAVAGAATSTDRGRAGAAPADDRSPRPARRGRRRREIGHGDALWPSTWPATAGPLRVLAGLFPVDGEPGFAGPPRHRRADAGEL